MAPLTESVIARLREWVRTGALAPGQRLPPEAVLADSLGASRGILREAVRSLVTAGILDVRRGDGTYVTDLTPTLLLGGLGEAVELFGDGSLLEVLECRRLLEPQVTGLAALRATQEDLATVRAELESMREATNEEERVTHDAAFHVAVAQASGNSVAAAVLLGISSVTMRARVWRAVSQASSSQLTIAEHAAILAALEQGDADGARAAALLHVTNVERWAHSVIGADRPHR